MYQTIAPQFAEVNAHFFNAFVRYGFSLAILEKSNIVPKFKISDYTYPKNYRPISVLNFIAKLLEKLMHKQLITFFVKKNILCNETFGFRQKLKTTDAVDEYLDHVC